MGYRAPLSERLRRHVVVDETGCWEWQLRPNNSGYGLIWVGGVRRTALAHRVAYELFVGPIPDGLEIDHLCRNRLCVRPDHLEPVTHAENMRRSQPHRFHGQPSPTHCPRGHLYTEANTYYPPSGSQECRTCRKLLRSRVAA